MTKTSKRNHYNQSSKRATNREKINLPFRHDGVLRWRASFVLYIEDWKKKRDALGEMLIGNRIRRIQQRSRNPEECERNASLVETKKKATNRKTYHLRHDEIVLSYTRVRGFQSVLGYSLLVFVKKRRNAFFLMTTKNVFFFRGEFCLNKISIGKLEIHLHFQSTLR